MRSWGADGMPGTQPSLPPCLKSPPVRPPLRPGCVTHARPLLGDQTPVTCSVFVITFCSARSVVDPRYFSFMLSLSRRPIAAFFARPIAS